MLQTHQSGIAESGQGERHPSVVGIGASAGGLTALKELVRHVPADSGFAYVVVVHLAPEHESHLAELLQSHADLPITQVTETTPLEADHVYVIPPNANLEAVDTHLRLSELEDSREDRGPIDHFFRTLAESHGGDAAGVVLTGTGSDGALGIRAIKGCGGLTVVQDPKEAEYTGMPRSALATGAVDLVLPLVEIPDAVARYARTKPRVPVVRDGEGLDRDSRRLLDQLFRQLVARADRDFTRYKPSTILRRIQHRMQLRQLEELEDYVELLTEDLEEVEALADDLLIKVTRFFRDPGRFETLQEDVIAELFAAKGRDDQLRVWSVGCATGEEAYSLAILLLEEASRREDPAPRLRVFATDIHEPSLEAARAGLFAGDIKADVSAERLDRFFTAEDGGYRVRSEVRDLVVFARHNVLSDPPFSHMDLVLCRNLLIYLDRDAQDEVLRMLHYSLEPDGRLLLGTSETVGDTDLFDVAAQELHLYRPKDVADRELPLPAFSFSRPFVEADTARKEPPTARSYGELHEKLVERHAPPSILLDPSDEAVHVSERAGRYLVHPGGTPTMAATRIVRKELQVELANVLREARDRMEPVRSRLVDLSIDGSRARVVMDARPSPEPGDDGYVLVIFDERPHPADEGVAREGDTPASGRGGEPSSGAETERVRELEAELARTRDRLRAAVDKHAASREKMQASNEELQSMNEELRSTLEELETSKEELQSMNEELQTLNQENRQKVEELNLLTSDLKNLLASTDIATMFLDRELRIRRFTPRVPDLFNIQDSDRGRSISDLTHRLDYDQLTQDAEQVLARLTPVEREVQDEAGRTYLTRVLPYRTADDRIDGVVINFVDITRRRQMEEELREAKTFSENIVETLHEPLLVLTPELEVIHANPAFFEHFNVEPDDALDRKIYDLDNGQWDIPELHELLEDLLPASDAFSDFEVKHEFDDLGERIMLLNARRLDHVDRILLGIRDVTAQRELERHARQRQRLESVGLLAGGVAHDFNNLLTAVEGHASLLMDELAEDSPLQDDLREIQRAGQQAAKLTSQLLAFSREQVLQSRNIPLGRVTRALEDLLHRLIPERIELDITVASEDPVVRIDTGQLQQVVVNLVLNAAEAVGGAGRITVEVDATTLSENDAQEIPWSVEPGPFGRLTVRDTGAGMTPEIMERMFEPFFTTKGDVSGTGLGLSTVYGIIKQSGGHILVDSALEEGTTFQVLLPRQPDDTVEDRDRTDRPSEADRDAWTPEGQIILVVEDDDAVRGVACRMLDKTGYSCIEAASGDEALAYLEDSDQHVDLVLSDVVMPGLSGVDLVKRIDTVRPDVLVVLMSGFAEPELHHDIEVGADAFVPKPFTRDQLLDSIRTALERARG